MEDHGVSGLPADDCGGMTIKECERLIREDEKRLEAMLLLREAFDTQRTFQEKIRTLIPGVSLEMKMTIGIIEVDNDFISEEIEEIESSIAEGHRYFEELLGE